MEGLTGPRIVWSGSLTWMLGAGAVQVTAGVGGAWALLHGTRHGHALWGFVALACFATVVAVMPTWGQAMGRYMARDRVKSRFGLPPDGTPVRMRDAQRLSWGSLRTDPGDVARVLGLVTGTTWTPTAHARQDARSVAQLVRRRAVVDGLAVVAVFLALLALVWLAPIDPVWLRLLALPAAAPLLTPFVMALTASRQQDPWLAWYKRHAMDPPPRKARHERDVDA